MYKLYWSVLIDLLYWLVLKVIDIYLLMCDFYVNIYFYIIYDNIY